MNNYKFINFVIILILIITIILSLIKLFQDKTDKTDNFTNYAYMGLCQTIPKKSIGPTGPNCNQIDFAINKDDIIKRYLDLSYEIENENGNKNGNENKSLPNGGLLVSMFDHNYLCESNESNGSNGSNQIYKSFVNIEKNETCANIDDCSVIDLKDIKKIINKNTTTSNTSCYALDTTYLRADIASIVFGPLINLDIDIIDMNIGVILDVNIIKKYIACMGISDSASVGRYNRDYNKFIKENSKKLSNLKQTKVPSKVQSKVPGYIPSYIPTNFVSENIETSDITDNEIKYHYDELLNSKKGRQLAQAGCGLQTNFQGPNLSGIYNSKYLPTNKINSYRGADKVIIDKYDDKNGPFDINNGPFHNNNGPFDEYKNENENDNNKNNKTSKHKGFLSGEWSVNQQLLRRNSWYEFVKLLKQKNEYIKKYGGNEKLWNDLILKLNSGTYVNIYLENEVDIFVPNKEIKNGGKNCEPTKEFQEIWKKAVIGIFTNNRCLKDIKHNKLCNNCKKLQSYDCGNGNTNGNTNGNENGNENINTIRCCCNKDFNENLVRKLVLKYNQNSEHIINGYIMEDNLNPSKNLPDKNLKTGLYDLSIKQITNYKSYYNIPIFIQKNEYYNQFYYNIKCNSICGYEDKNYRTLAIAIPINKNGKYILNFSFTINQDAAALYCNDGKYIYSKGGVINQDFLHKNCEKNKGLEPSTKYYQNYLHEMLKLGYTIISLTECDWDTNSFLPGKDLSKNSEKCSMYWQNQNNSDARYLQSIFKELYCNNFIDEKQNIIKLNYNEMGIIGYSVGAQAVSRCFNDFPLMYTMENNTGEKFKFPDIKMGIMIAGGSYYCYSDYVNNSKEQLKKCIDPKIRGCCPVGITEMNYDKNKDKYSKFSWSNHPYTLLIQSDKDIWADPQAALKYYNSTPIKYRGEFLDTNNNGQLINYEENKLVYVQYSNSTIHGLSNDNQVKNMINFTINYL